jgi:hypothetical protein
MAERMMRWSLEAADRPAVLGDLQEEFTAIALARGSSAAVRWYRRQVATSIGPNLTRLITGRIRRRTTYLRAFWAVFLFVAGLCKPIAFSVFGGNPEYSLTGVGYFDLYVGGAAGCWLLTFLLSDRVFDSMRARVSERRWVVVCCLALMHDASRELFGHEPGTLFTHAMLASQVLILVLPLRPLSLLATEYRVYTPVVQGWRDKEGSPFLMTAVPAEAMEMSRPIMGLATPAFLPPDDVVSGVVPMKLTIERSFPSTQVLRVFAVVQATPTATSAVVELRNASDRVVRVIPAIVAPGHLAERAVPDGGARTEANQTHEPVPPIMSVDAIVPLLGLAPGAYCLRLIATAGSTQSHQDEQIVIE